MVGRKNIEKWNLVENCLFYLLEKPHAKTDLANFVYGEVGPNKVGPNISRLEYRLLKPNKKLFNIKTGRKAWKENVSIRPDDRIKVVSINWNEFLNLWEEKRKRILCFNQWRIKYTPDLFIKVKELIKEQSSFLFNYNHFKNLFTIKGKLYLPSIFGLIDTSIFYAYFCGGIQTPEGELPYYMKRIYSNRENFRALFKLYYFMRIEKEFQNISFSKLFDIITKNEEKFFKKHTKLHRKLYGKGYHFASFFNYIDLVNPSVSVIDSKEGKRHSFNWQKLKGKWTSFSSWKLLSYGINVNIDKKFIEDKIEKANKSVIPKDKIDIPITFEEFLPTFEPLMWFKSIFD